MIKKEEIIKYLTDSGVYNETDLYLIEQFIDNLRIYREAKAELKKTGLLVNVARPENMPCYQKSPALSILDSCTKNLLNISRKLGLSPFDRANLKIQLDDENDGFDG